MSKLGRTLDTLDLSKSKTKPRASCFPLYGEGDDEDRAAIDRLRDAQVSWEDIQRSTDDILGIDESRRINTRRFVRHWRGQCSCWESQR